MMFKETAIIESINKNEFGLAGVWTSKGWVAQENITEKIRWALVEGIIVIGDEVDFSFERYSSEVVNSIVGKFA